MIHSRSWSALFAAVVLVGCTPSPGGGDTGPGGDASDSATNEDTSQPDVQTTPDASADDVAEMPDTGGMNMGTVLTEEVPEDIAVAAGYVYFTREGQVRRIPIGGGTSQTFYMAAMSGPTGIAADGDGVAWTERFGSTVQGAVRSCPHTGCPAMPVVYGGGESTNRVAVAPTHVAWTSATAASVFVRDRATGNGGAGYRAANQMQYTPSDIALDGDEMFWTTAGISIPGGGTGGTPGQVLRCNVSAASCTPMVLAEGAMIGHPDRIALGPGVVYFMSNTGVFRVGRDGTGLAQLAPVMTGTGRNTFNLATDGTVLYWAIGPNLYTCNAASCTPSTVVEMGIGFTQGLEVDATSVYWATMNLSRQGGIRRYAR